MMNAMTRTNLNQFLESLHFDDARSMNSVSGGSINDAYKIESSKGVFFLKTNSASRFPQMFEAELKGLELLSQSEFIIPKPIAMATINDDQFILMDWVEKGAPKEGFWGDFGQSLARLHEVSDPSFGLNHDNYIGSLKQSNTKHDNWYDFYREERLIPQMKLAENTGRLSDAMSRGFDGLFKELENIFPREKPSLIHGDLWGGNMMITKNGQSSIFDPAVYFGHREMDLAMMALFGGFGDAWVDAYNEVYPLESGWRKRIPIGQLYPLMVHVNLFGGGYGRDVEQILHSFRK